MGEGVSLHKYINLKEKKKGIKHGIKAGVHATAFVRFITKLN
jgi:hypothetical protein